MEWGQYPPLAPSFVSQDECFSVNKHMKYNIMEIQSFYDSGKSWRDIREKFGVSMGTLSQWVKKGLFKTRSKRDGLLLKIKQGWKCHHTEETKQKLSKIRKAFLLNHPDKIPYRKNHSSKPSYPETYFEAIFSQYQLDLKSEWKVGTYSLDFAEIKKKIDVEIDGEQHFVDPKIVAHDIKRTEFLKSKGWKIIRLRWAHYQQLSFDNKKRFIESIVKMINDCENNPVNQIEIDTNQKTRTCSYCGNKFKITFKSQRFCNRKCSGKGTCHHTLRPSKQTLAEELENFSVFALSKKYGVCNSTILKWLHRYGIKKSNWLTKQGVLFDSLS
jgi:very-short-patch-repair endonuclease/transposase